jgi:hypothetical protein
VDGRRRQALLLSSFVRRRRLPDFGEPLRSARSAAEAAVGHGADAAAVAVAVAVAVACHRCYRWAWLTRVCVLP